jgi:hypothetical protein
MAVKIKPVGASEIKDPKIAREAIAQVRRKPSPEAIARMEERLKLYDKVMAQ